MDEDAFETVAITYSQPETAVLLSMLAFYGVVAYPVGRWHGSVMPIWMVALGGVHIRVAHGVADEARELLAEVAARPAAIRPYLIGNRLLNGVAVLLLCLLGAAPVPPTRTPSTFLPGRRAA